MLSDSGLPEAAVDAAQRIGNTEARWRALGRNPRDLPQPLREAAMERAQHTRGPVKRIRALQPYLPWLADAEVHRLLEDIPVLRNKAEEAAAYARIAERLPEPKATRTLERALDQALEAGASPVRAQALATVAARLPAPLVRTALTRVKHQKAHQTPALAALAARHAELGHPEEAIDLVSSLADGDQRATTLAAMARHLPAAAVSQALALAGVMCIRDRGTPRGRRAGG